MDSITRNVKDMTHADRRALEQVIGQPLAESAQVTLQIVEVGRQSKQGNNESGPASTTAALPDWCNVYKGLSDEEVSAIEQVVLTRADLSRLNE